LLSNAIKYSPEDSNIQFDLICESGNTIFQIQDSGIGIPLKERSQLFTSFHRGSNVGKIEGIGLGLSIVKQCVDLHGGEIAIESEPGIGTKVTVTLPAHHLAAKK
jgi:signal transduction histidine kinase